MLSIVTNKQNPSCLGLEAEEKIQSASTYCQAEDPSSYPQHPQKRPGQAACPYNSSRGKRMAQTFWPTTLAESVNSSFNENCHKVITWTAIKEDICQVPVCAHAHTHRRVKRKRVLIFKLPLKGQCRLIPKRIWVILLWLWSFLCGQLWPHTCRPLATFRLYAKVQMRILNPVKYQFTPSWPLSSHQISFIPCLFFSF